MDARPPPLSVIWPIMALIALSRAKSSVMTRCSGRLLGFARMANFKTVTHLPGVHASHLRSCIRYPISPVLCAHRCRTVDVGFGPHGCRAIQKSEGCCLWRSSHQPRTTRIPSVIAPTLVRRRGNPIIHRVTPLN